MSEVVWLGFAIPDDLADDIFKLDNNPAVQTHKFGWSMISALKIAFDEVCIISAAPVQNYPLCKRLIFKGGNYKVDDAKVNLIGFVNAIALKQITRLVNCMLVLRQVVKNKKPDWIIIHGAHLPFLLAGVIYRLMGFKVGVVITDMPGLHVNTDGWLTKYLKKIDALIGMACLRRMSVLLVLSEKIAEKINKNLPTFVFPGVVYPKIRKINFDLPNKQFHEMGEGFTVMYAGGLNEIYGVKTLVDSMSHIGLEMNIKLKLYGAGDMVEYIVEKSKIDNRIKYGGFLNDVEMVQAYRGADLLINPRLTSSNLSELSFPSKLIEYVITEKIVLTTRIKSIPEVILSCFLYIDDETKMGVADSILRIAKMDLHDRKNFAKKAKATMLNAYSVEVLGGKIKNFLNGK